MALHKFEVTNRWSGSVRFTAEIDCAEDAPRRIKLGLAVRWGLKAGAYLADANLADANLADANLAGANLAGANLADANLAGANLAGAYLADANLAGANLAGANLADAKWRDGIVISKPPIQVFGLGYRVTILDAHMQIGCELHSLAEWEAFDNERIARMAGVAARRFWDAHKDGLLALARGAGRSFEPVAVASEGEAREMLARTPTHSIEPRIGMGATIILYTDRKASTVISVVKAGKELTVREDIATRTDDNGVSDMGQTYGYAENRFGREWVFTLRRNGQWVAKGDGLRTGVRLRLGERDHYHDYGF